jgi:hypothetical protein
MAWSLYGVFLPDNKWALVTNKRKALTLARKRCGYVTSMPYKDSGPSWDAPTFRVCSDLVADYTTDKRATRFYSAA